MQIHVLRRILIYLVLCLIALSTPAYPGLAQTGSPEPFQKPAPDHDPNGPAPIYPAANPVRQAPAAPAAPSSLHDWARMAYQTYQTGNWEIFYASGSNGSPVNLTNSPDSDTNPSLSKDNSRIAFNSNPAGNVDIYTINVDGSGYQRLTTHDFLDYSPAWSPDGKSIAFVSNRDRSSKTLPGEIYVMNADGTAQTRLTFDGRSNDSPAWSPDGSKIAWVEYYGSAGAVHVMNSDGSNPLSIIQTYPYLDHPVWSPDGNQIAFDCDFDFDGWNEIVIMNSDGSYPRVVYNPNTSSTYLDALMGDWLYNGDIYFSLVKYVVYNGSLYIESSYIYFIKAFTNTSTLITSSGFDMSPSLAPMDLLPPVSNISPLPPLSRASDFYLDWQTRDNGPSGVHELLIQYSLEGSGYWQDFAHYTPLPDRPVLFPGQPGKTIYFRSAAIDDAENVEAWSADPMGDAQTQFFSHLLGGSIRDERDVPLTGSTLNMQPSPWETNLTIDPEGSFLAHMLQPGPVVLGAANPNFGSLNGITVNAFDDTTIQLNLPPKTNLLQNGSFETGLSGWSVAGTLTTTTASGYSQFQSARLGGPRSILSLTQAETIGAGNIHSFPNAAIDRHGNLHVISDRVEYRVRDNTGTWSPVEILTDHGSSGFVEDNRSEIAIDQFGNVSVISKAYDGIYYYRKPAGGAWTAGENIGGGFDPDLAVDSQGTVYTIFAQGGGNIVFRKRNLSGLWDPPVIVYAGFGGSTPTEVVVGPDDIVHFFGAVFHGELFQRDLLPYGSLGPFEYPLGYQPSYSVLRAGVDQSNKIHLIVQNWSDIYGTRQFYAYRNEIHAWSTPLLVGSLDEADMAVSHTGDVYIAGFIPDSHDRINLFYLASNASNFQDYSFTIPFTPLQKVAIASDGSTLNLLWGSDNGIKHVRTVSPGWQYETISQTTLLPQDLNKPTLSFMAKLDGANEQTKTMFEVRISAGISDTQIFSTTQGAEWAHYWFDLAPWAGQTITTTFGFQQSGGQAYSHLLLDNVSISAWLTPQPETVFPSQISENWASTQVTITGNNFMETPVVLIGNALALDVVRVDEHTLLLKLPANLRPGMYTVKVTNPGGQATVLGQKLLLGKTLFLPMLSRR